MKALIDGDLLLYRSGFACQESWLYVYEVGNEKFGWLTRLKNKTEYKKWLEFHPGEYWVAEEITPEPIENYIHIMKSTIKSILFETGADRYIVYLTGPDNYRDRLATLQPYKGNRDRTRKPVLYEQAKTYLINQMGAMVMQGCEADDGMSIEQWGEWDKRIFMEKEETPTIICTGDKDLDMVPGPHYNWTKKRRYFVEELDGMRFFFKQVLTGDPIDNIPGLFRCTGVKATKRRLRLIDDMVDYVDMVNFVQNEYLVGLMNEYTTPEDIEQIKYMVEEIMKLLWMSRKKPNDCIV